MLYKETFPESILAFEDVLKTVDDAVFARNQRHLKNIEIAVLKGSWQGQRYDQIAAESGYTPEYIKHDVGPKLWQLLSSSFGEKVNKNNLLAVVLHHASSSAVESTDMSAIALPSEPPCRPLPLNSALYVERPAIESRCFEEIQRPGGLIRIKAPSQMGKTSLMIRILEQVKQRNSENKPVHTVALSLQQADRAIFENLDQFLRWFCAAITRKLQLPHRVEEYWSDFFGSKSNCTAYFEDCILPSLNGVFVLALDDVDAVFLHPAIADDFFTLLRSWYEEAAYGTSGNALWQNFRLILVHSTEVYIPLDINQSPFNVGLAIELKEFSATQVTTLAQQYQLTLSEREQTILMQLVGGHPFLIQQALYYLSQREMSFNQLIESATTDAGIYRNHLHRLLNHLKAQSTLAIAFTQVIVAQKPIELEVAIAFKLQSIGLVKLQNHSVIVSCQVYKQYFNHQVLSKSVVAPPQDF